MQRRNIRILVDTVTKILVCFLRGNKERICQYTDYRHFEIELSRRNNFSFIQVTNCGQYKGDVRQILSVCFDSLSISIDCQSYIQSVTLFIKQEGNEEFIYESQQVQNRWEMVDVTMDRQCEHFAHLKKYLSLKIQCTPMNINFFKQLMIRNLEVLEANTPNVKYIFHTGEDIFWRNHVQLDKPLVYCKIVSSAITSIFNNAVNIRFKDRCCKLLNVISSFVIKDAAMNKLAALIYKKFRDKKNSRVNYDFRRKKQRLNGTSKKNHVS